MASADLQVFDAPLLEALAVVDKKLRRAAAEAARRENPDHACHGVDAELGIRRAEVSYHLLIHCECGEVLEVSGMSAMAEAYKSEFTDFQAAGGWTVLPSTET